MTTFRRTDRTDAPYYLARYNERRGLRQSSPTSSPADEDLPLYLRRFRERGTQATPSALLEVDGLEIDLARRIVRVEGREVHLTPTEVDLLRQLVRNRTARELEQALGGGRFGVPQRHGKWLIAPVGDSSCCCTSA